MRAGWPGGGWVGGWLFVGLAARWVRPLRSGGLGLDCGPEGWNLEIRKKKCCFRTLVTTHLDTPQPSIVRCSPVL